MRFFIRHIFAILLCFGIILSGFPVDFSVVLSRGRIVDRVYLAMQNDLVIDNFYFGQYAEAAQVQIEPNLFDATDEYSPSPNVVFISDQVGYAFYVDTGVDNVSYSKTTDGGTSWGADVDMLSTMGTDLNWAAVAVWYDQWTPGDTSGTLIHIAAVNATDDDVYYASLDTNGDVRLNPNTVITGTTGTVFTPAGDGSPFITKATDGDLFAGACGTFSSVVQCVMHTSTDVGANWGGDIGHSSWNDDDDSIQFFPLSGGDILAIFQDDTANTISTRVYDQSTGWDGSALLNRALTDSATYDISWGAALNKSTGNVYLAFSNAIALDSTTNDIEVWKYTESSRTWGQKTNVLNDTEAYQASVSLDANTGDIYVTYAQGNGGADVADDSDIFYVKSTDDGSNWGSPIQLNSTANLDLWFVRTNMYSDSRLYSVWYDNTGNDLYGETVADLWAWEQAAYRFFNNANGTDVGSVLGNQDTAATLASTGDAFRLRLLLHNTGQIPISGENLKLQFAERSGTCDTGFSGESYADVTGATVIAYNNNATPADGDNLTANANDPTHSGHTIVNQDYEEANNFTNSVALIPSGQDGKWDFSLKDNGASASTAYCFRIVKSDDSGLDVYSIIPQITTAAAAGGAPTLSFSISDNSIGFGTLSSGAERYATGDLTGSASEVAAHTITASTTASSGYSILLNGSTLIYGASNIDAIGGTNTTSTPGTEQFGLRITASGGNGTVSVPYVASGFAFDTGAFPDQIASDPDGDNNATTYSLRYVANISATTGAGNYSSTLTYIITATF